MPRAGIAVAATAPTAATFGLHPGSRLYLCPAVPGDPAVTLLVTGVVRPAGPSSAFWQYDPVLAAPQLRSVSPDSRNKIWFGGLLAGPGELAALQRAYSGAGFQGTWFFPLDMSGLTAGSLPRVLAGAASVASSGAAVQTQIGQGTLLTAPPVVSSGLADALAGFISQQQAVSAIDSLLVVGLAATVVILLLVCAALVAEANGPELALVRARGGSTAQVTGRMFARACCLAALPLAAGAVLAAVLVPADSATPWLLGGIVAGAALLAPAVIAGWAHRRARGAAGRAAGARGARGTRWGEGGAGAAAGAPGAPGGRGHRLRRLAAELAVLAAAAGALVALRRQGIRTGGDPYLSASVVLAAAAAGLIVARVYPVLIRPFLIITAGRPGAVGFLGLVGAARSRLGAMLPALALAVTLTLTAFGAVIAGSVAAGQSAASWQQVGADAMVQAAGDNTVTAAAQRAIRAVPGVRHTAAVYTAGSQSTFAATLGSQKVGLVVADPAQYAALAADTPWPGFPARLLGRKPPGTVPLLATPDVAAPGGRARSVLVVDGARLPVTISGRIGATAAMPAGGGPYVMLPARAARRFPSIPGPQTLLITGRALDVPALRAAVARQVPGGRLTLRRQVLAGMAGSPAQRAGVRVEAFGIWAAAALGVVAVLFALAASARGRAQLMTRLEALGMARRQSWALTLTAPAPLLGVAVLGMVAAVLVLTAVTGPVLDLSVFTGPAAAPVPVRPGVIPLLVPAVAACLLATLIMAAERVVSRRHDAGAALRYEEG